MSENIYKKKIIECQSILTEHLVPDSQLSATDTISKLLEILDNQEFVKFMRLKEHDVHDFSWALRMVKLGNAIQRKGWNGAGLKVMAQFPDKNSKMSLPYLYIEYPDGRRCPWLASQTDIMETDWVVVV